jgi:hypothetical protein
MGAISLVAYSIKLLQTSSISRRSFTMDQASFDEVLGLEDTFYNDGYQQGLTDGVKAGQIEGRTFGLEKGLEKHLQSGRLDGKSLVWANRIPQFQRSSISISEQILRVKSATESKDDMSTAFSKLPNLPDNSRLAKHVIVLHAFAESESLATENTEEAVSDFDDRLKRSLAKARIIERMAGELRMDENGYLKGSSSNDSSIENASVLKARY